MGSKQGRSLQSSASPISPFSSSPLSLAHCSCLEFLLDNGADPSLRDKQGYTAVHYAAAYGNRQNLELVSEPEKTLCAARRGGEVPPKEHVKPYSVLVWLEDCVCCRHYSVSVCPGGREIGLIKKHGGSWGAVVLGIPRRKDLGLSEMPERKELCYPAQGDVWMSCLKPWQ